MKIEKLEYFTGGIAKKDGSIRWTYHPTSDDIVNKINEIIDKLNEMEEAEPARHGYWVVDEDGNIKCSECGYHGVGDNYCERCGAKMDEANNE